MLRTVDRISRTKDPLLVITNVLSENVSRENAESRSSLDSMEKRRRNSAKVTMPMVRATASPCVWSAQLITLRVPIAISRPAKASQTRSARVRIGRLGGSGGRSIRPAGGVVLTGPSDREGRMGKPRPHLHPANARVALAVVQ